MRPRREPHQAMLCDRVLGNVGSDATGRYAGRPRDALELTWRECARRAVRGRTANGLSVGILLPPGAHLRHGDVIADDDAAGLVVVAVSPCEVWVADFADAAALATAALELGNLHVPVEVADPLRLMTPPDGPSRGVLDRLAAAWRAETRRFQPLRATVSAGGLRVAESFKVMRPGSGAAAAPPPQLMNNRE
jgi:urease accessory protein UreE